jgi:hypothetical protein
LTLKTVEASQLKPELQISISQGLFNILNIGDNNIENQHLLMMASPHFSTADKSEQFMSQ